MSRPHLAVIALLLIAGPLEAQARALVRAFPRSAGAALGVSGFRPRSIDAGRTFSYKGSLSVHGRFDTPITRRTGFLLSLGLAPLSRQVEENQNSTLVANRLMVGTADAALAFRFKPTAAVFFAGGGGLTHATKPPVPGAEGSLREPHVLLAIGYDGRSSKAWNIRGVLTNRLIFIGDDEDPTTKEGSRARDWSLEFGFRYVFRGATGR